MAADAALEAPAATEDRHSEKQKGERPLLSEVEESDFLGCTTRAGNAGQILGRRVAAGVRLDCVISVEKLPRALEVSGAYAELDAVERG